MEDAVAASAAPRRRDRPPTCVDDDADHGLRVPDGAASKQQVFLVQPGLLPVVMRAAEGVCHVSPRCPHALTPGAGRGGEQGPRAGSSPQWILQQLDGACAYDWQLGF